MEIFNESIIKTDSANNNKKLGMTETTFTKIEFDKNNLFFRSVPNKISYDKVKIKNTGTTCIYFKWQKYVKPFILPEKKSDGIDRFFCHYSDSKLFPDEEKEFVFSFFSEKNGVFSEDLGLVTSPPIKSSNLIVHLNGMCLDIQDKYSQSINSLEADMEKRFNRTMIEEMVLDLVTTIKQSDPPLPDMSDPNIFRFYFMLNNKEYNVEYSQYIMRESNVLLNQIHDVMNTPVEERYWNGSFDNLKLLINSIAEEETKNDFLFKLNTLIQLGRRKYAEDSLMTTLMKEKLMEVAFDFNEIANSIREELQIPSYTFDLFTRQSIATEKEMNLYKNELNKKKDEFYKRTKKKPPKPEEEEKEMNEYKVKLFALVKEKLLEKFTSIESEKLNYVIEDLTMNSYQMDEEYIDRLARVKCLKTVKNDGLEGKTVILRIDIDDYELVYENILDDEEEVVGQSLKEINFLNAKETILQTMNFLLDNRVKACVLLCDFGPKFGIFNSNFRMKFFKEFLERESLIEQAITYFPNITDLYDLQRKIDSEEVFKDNSLIIVENLNFYPEECGFEIENNPFLTTQPGSAEHLKYFSRLNFASLLSLRKNEVENLHSFKNQLFVLDSPKAILKKYPSVIDMQTEVKCLGMRLETQIQKLTNFFSINSPNFMLIIGDINTSENESIDDQSLLNSLLIMSCLLPRFKRIFIMGKLAILFIQYIQNDYVIDPRYKTNQVFNNLIKYILVRAELNKVKIVLPEDGVLLSKTEFEKFKPGYKFELVTNNKENENLNLNDINSSAVKNDQIDIETLDNAQNEPIIIEDYYKYIKKLFKMEKRMKELVALKMDPEELLEHEDYIKNKLSDDQLILLEGYKNNSVEFKTLHYRRNFVEMQQISKPKKILKNNLEVRTYLENMYNKPVVFPYNPNPLNVSLNVSKISEPVHEEPSYRSKTINNNALFNNEEFEFIDWGEKTYDNLTRYFGKMNCVMWLGKLAPSNIENLYDNYAKIVRSLYERKQKLRSEFNELMLEEEKKLHETDLKAKKHLFTIFLKSKSSYELIRRNFLTFMLPAEDKDAEVPPDEEQFNYEMNLLIDNYITEEFEFLNSILSGKHVPGLFGLSQEPKKEKEQEIDLKFLEEIY